jgi:hypothetical protein
MEVLPLDLPTIVGLLRLGCAEEFADEASEDSCACSGSRKINPFRSTNYTVQVRALGGSTGQSDWSDPRHAHVDVAPSRSGLSGVSSSGRDPSRILGLDSRPFVFAY